MDEEQYDEQGVQGRLRRIERVLFFGNGTRALTARADRADQEIEAVKDTIKSVKDDVAAINRNIRWAVLLVMAAVIAQILKLIFVKGG